MAPWPPPTRRQQRPPSSSRDNPECPQGHKTALLGDRRAARCWPGAGAVGHRDVPASTLSSGLRDSPHILPHSSCILRGAAWSAEPLAPRQGNGGSPACFTLTRDSAGQTWEQRQTAWLWNSTFWVIFASPGKMETALQTVSG